ncbi:MAG: hypothetical protein KJ967_05760, partial [Elusimicrobia bacterium]|nr:hypothetical protein [Elusimicrobiota bacterium]
MKIKLLRVPHYSYIKQSNQKMKCENFPPLAPAVITSYLRGKGIDIEQDDLNVKVHYDNVYNTDYSGRVDGKIFHDKERVMNFINGNRDSELENVGENILKKSNVDGFDLILLSIPSLIDISPLLSTLVIAKILKEKTGCKIIAGGGSGAELEIGMREGIIDYFGSEHGEVLSECFIRTVESGRDVDNIPGLSYLKDGVMYSNPNTTPIVLPCPDFDGIPL